MRLERKNWSKLNWLLLRSRVAKLERREEKKLIKIFLKKKFLVVKDIM